MKHPKQRLKDRPTADKSRKHEELSRKQNRQASPKGKRPAETSSKVPALVKRRQVASRRLHADEYPFDDVSLPSEAVAIWRPLVNSALMDLKRGTKAFFDFAIRLGKLLAEVKQAAGENVDWLAMLNVAISEREERFYAEFAKHAQAAEPHLEVCADTMPLKAMKLVDAAYHVATDGATASNANVTLSKAGQSSDEGEGHFEFFDLED